MNKELHPICFFINDREEMVNQMFSTMKEDKLRAMLPPILKGMQVDELKKACLEELLGMSSKRIQSVVAGQDLLSSSDSEDVEASASDDEDSPSLEDDSDSEPGNDQPPKSVQSSKTNLAEDSLQISISSDELEDMDETRTGPLTTGKHVAVKDKCLHKGSQPSSKSKKAKHSHKPEETSKEEASAKAEPEKTLLEMLELELRARAIRAALNHQEKISLLDKREPTGAGIVIEIKEENEKKLGEQSTSNVNVSIQESHTLQKSKNVHKENGTVKQENVELSCEEISSDEAMLVDCDDDGEPVFIEPVIESIIISSDSESEKPEEKQFYKEFVYTAIYKSSESRSGSSEEEKNKESWKERWMRRKDIATVMKASKLLTSVKQKMKRKKTDIALSQAAQGRQDQIQDTSTTPPTVIQGTVSEFNLLQSAATSSLGSGVVQSTPQNTALEYQMIKPTSEIQRTTEQGGPEEVVSAKGSESISTTQPSSETSQDLHKDEQIGIENTLMEYIGNKSTTDQKEEHKYEACESLLSLCDSSFASTSELSSVIGTSTNEHSSSIVQNRDSHCEEMLDVESLPTEYKSDPVTINRALSCAGLNSGCVQFETSKQQISNDTEKQKESNNVVTSTGTKQSESQLVIVSSDITTTLPSLATEELPEKKSKKLKRGKKKKKDKSIKSREKKKQLLDKQT